ncbi:hypothetical protein CPB83DRAFT_843627 [Crepidotus variabilis]|uniref:Uncharacterized protein n=1 Tax=Crepidotus variabilis TaxID=179855 RepID=A0A9P6EUA7_9AGAR|nr:hypothetical protein CPB83DRAFT_843627 [Crepidotus variabilis]
MFEPISATSFVAVYLAVLVVSVGVAIVTAPPGEYVSFHFSRAGKIFVKQGLLIASL